MAPATVSAPNFNSRRAPLSWSSMTLSGSAAPIWNGKLSQLVAQRVHGVVAQARNLPAAAFFDGQRLQDVVHFR